jgi:hypothetical protein
MIENIDAISKNKFCHLIGIYGERTRMRAKPAGEDILPAVLQLRQERAAFTEKELSPLLCRSGRQLVVEQEGLE